MFVKILKFKFKKLIVKILNDLQIFKFCFSYFHILNIITK